MAVTTYYLGANTPQGFCSRYDMLFADPRLKQVLIIKGGPGCGKSTLMKQVGRTAQALGLDVEEILCSSDPDSLDGLIIPAAAMALVDGTAPHVVEPPMCGCGASYLHLGAYYDTAALTDVAPRLFALKAKNAACYPLATACFRAAAGLEQGLCLLADQTPPLPEELLPTPEPIRATPGPRLERFYTAFSPKGVQEHPLLAREHYLLRDNFGLGQSLLAQAAQRCQNAGYLTITASHPLTPDKLSHVLVPELELAYTLATDVFPSQPDGAIEVDLDHLVQPHLTPERAVRASLLRQYRQAAVTEGLAYLKEAKAIHNDMEALYRPAVDFAGVDTATAAVKKQLLARLAANECE